MRRRPAWRADLVAVRARAAAARCTGRPARRRRPRRARPRCRGPTGSSTNSCVSGPQYSPKSGPSVVRARVGLSPTIPHMLAGKRIEPPMSLPCATGTSPAATAAAEPPLDPPVLRVSSHGLCVGAVRERFGRDARRELGRVGLADEHEARGAEARREPRVVGLGPARVLQHLHARSGTGRRRCGTPRPSRGTARPRTGPVGARALRRARARSAGG